MNVLKLCLLMLVVSGCGDDGIPKEVYQKDMKLALAERDACKKEKALLYKRYMKARGCTKRWMGWSCPPEAKILPVEE